MFESAHADRFVYVDLRHLECTKIRTYPLLYLKNNAPKHSTVVKYIQCAIQNQFMVMQELLDDYTVRSSVYMYSAMLFLGKSGRDGCGMVAEVGPEQNLALHLVLLASGKEWTRRWERESGALWSDSGLQGREPHWKKSF